MINIGIDVGKFKHCAAVIDDKTGEVLIKQFFFSNDQEGFDFFYSKVKRYIHRRHAVGMEDTGHYMINLTNYLLEKKLSVKYINPRSTNLRRKELGISAKNDKKDTLLIAEMLSEKKFWRSVSKSSMETSKLRELTRLYHQLQEQQRSNLRPSPLLERQRSKARLKNPTFFPAQYQMNTMNTMVTHMLFMTHTVMILVHIRK